jgi:alginate O-acetyltransferase complex protein AlgI
MDNFFPTTTTSILLLVAGVITIILIGFGITFLKNHSVARLISWIMAFTATFLTHDLTLTEPPGYRMLAIILILFSSMKVIVAHEYSVDHQRLTFTQWIAFALTWFGMNPGVFSRRTMDKKSQGIQLIRFGLSRIGIGLLLCVAAYVIFKYSSPSFLITVLVTACLLAGLSLTLHFGILNINSGIWNLMGVGTYALFKAPFRSLSLGEFWGRRWNFAFSEMTSIAVHRPLRKITNHKIATVAAFAFSGLLHELAISLPVNRGYGLPALYFVIQAVALLLEKKIQFKSTTSKHVWVLFWLIIPIPLLFHKYFLEGIIWPIIGFE